MSKRRKGRWKYNYCHAGRVQQELRANSEYREDGERVKWGRGCRSIHELDQWLNDKPHNREKSWKRKRKTQYRDRAQMQEYVLDFDDILFNDWELNEWFDDHDIPYRWETFRKAEYRTIKGYWRNVFDYTIPYVDHRGINRLRCIYKRVFVPYKKPRRDKYSKITGYRLTWWSDKDIGIEQLMTRFSCSWRF
jgi:hypothetical protein